MRKTSQKLKTLLKLPKHRKTINGLYSWPTDDTRKYPVLSFACYINTCDFVKILLENGARDDIEDTDGNFQIHRACDSDIDALAKVKMLVEHNADNVNRRGTMGLTPLMCVSCNDTLEYLIQKGAQVDDVSEDSCSALHLASYDNRPIIVNTLLSHGADSNLGDITGDTPLHYGAEEANLDVIKALVASPSCDVHLKNEEGKTALDVARSKPAEGQDYDPVIDYLEDVVMNPVALLGIRLNSMDISCDALKVAKNQMNESQCKRCDDLAKRVLDLEKQMEQVINDNKKSEALGQKERDLIQQLQEEIRKLNEQIRQLTLEIESIKSRTIVGAIAQSSESAEYSGNCNFMFNE